MPLESEEPEDELEFEFALEPEEDEPELEPEEDELLSELAESALRNRGRSLSDEELSLEELLSELVEPESARCSTGRFPLSESHWVVVWVLFECIDWLSGCSASVRSWGVPFLFSVIVLA